MKVVLLDGGMGQELVHRSGREPTPLWSTQVMLDQPDLVRQIHADFFAAGATIATTNTYAVLHDRLDKFGMAGRLDDLTDTALTAAETARAGAGRGRIAGSIGPLGASYRPDLCPPAAEAAKSYAGAVARLKDRVDLLIFETMASVDQAEGALLAGAGAGLPVWLAVTVSDTDGARLRSGEPLADLAPVLARHRPDAVLINCSCPELIAVALDIVRGFGLPFGAYANGFATITEDFLKESPTVDALSGRRDLTPAIYADFALGWVAQGASIVGGCCEVGPAHIAELADRLRAAGHHII